MIGSILGDIIGSRFEFMSTQEKQVTLLHSACSWTDDTLLTSVVADVCSQIKKENILDELEIENLFINGFKKAVNDYPMAGWGKSFYDWAKSKENFYNNSAGNGCLMRISPLALYFDDLTLMQKIGRICTKITHDHIDSYQAVECYLEVLYYLVHNIDTKEDKKEKLKEIINKHNVNMEPVEKYHEIAGYYGLAKDTLPRALSSYLEANSFDETMKNVLYIGSDTDTNGTIAASLAELTYSIDATTLHNLYRYFDHKSFIIVKAIIKSYIENPEKFKALFNEQSQSKMIELFDHVAIDPTAQYDPLELPTEEEYYKGKHKKSLKTIVKNWLKKNIKYR